MSFLFCFQCWDCDLNVLHLFLRCFFFIIIIRRGLIIIFIAYIIVVNYNRSLNCVIN